MRVEYVYDASSGLYRRLDEGASFAVVYAREEHAALLAAALPRPCIVVTSRAEFISAAQRADIAFVDSDLLSQLDGSAVEPLVVAIVDDPDPRSRIVQCLLAQPWVSNFVSALLLSLPAGRAHVSGLFDRVRREVGHSLLPGGSVGRIALLTSSKRRAARFERIREFYVKHAVSPRTLAALADTYEELVTNALYDAPLEAQYISHAVPRTEDIELPRERACEISYGLDGESAFLRVRDTFGSLTRDRMLDVMRRCSTDAVTLDESRGGAGLGLWRVFLAASSISITVFAGQLTDILVEFAPRSRGGSKHVFAANLFFGSGGRATESFVPGGDLALVDHSITLAGRM